MKFLKKLRSDFERALATADGLAASVRSYTAELSELKRSVAAVENNTKFLAVAKKQEHLRQGHKL